MRILIFFSKDNMASENLFDFFKNKFDLKLVESKKNSERYSINDSKYSDVELINFDSNMVEWDHLKDEFELNYDIILVASSHKAESGTKSLTLHYTGNFSKAMAGGNDEELSFAPSFVSSKGIELLSKYNSELDLNFEVNLETTHHGPTTIDVPLVFIEIGSSEKEWSDPLAIKVLSMSIVDLINFISDKNNDLLDNSNSYIGFGGGHYAPEFTKLVKMGINIGHMCPKHYIKNLNKELIVQMIEKTVPKPNKVLIEWKSLNAELRSCFLSILEELGVEIVKTDGLKKELRNNL